MSLKPYVATSVRFPVGILERLSALAEANRRSLNSEIVYRLQKVLETEEADRDRAAVSR